MPKSPRSWGPIQSVTYRYNTQKIQMLLPYTIETGDLVDAAPASRARDGPGIRCQNTRTDECKVVRKKPKRNTLVLVGDGTAYAGKKRATEVMGTIDDCKP